MGYARGILLTVIDEVKHRVITTSCLSTVYVPNDGVVVGYGVSVHTRFVERLWLSGVRHICHDRKTIGTNTVHTVLNPRPTLPHDSGLEMDAAAFIGRASCLPLPASSSARGSWR